MQTHNDRFDQSVTPSESASDGISFSKNTKNSALDAQNSTVAATDSSIVSVNVDNAISKSKSNATEVICEHSDSDTDSKTASKNKKDDKKKKNSKKKRNLWWIKATVISLVLSAFFSYLSEIVSNSDQLVVVIILLAFLILSGILFDAIGVAVTSCDTTPIISMASRKVYGAKTALWLTKNSDTVSSVCNDIVGDIFSIISGACAAALVVKITMTLNETWQIVLSIVVSAIVSAMTIGGKAFMKKIAIDNSKDFVMFVARFLAFFSKDERKIRKKQKEVKALEKKKEQENANKDKKSK